VIAVAAEGDVERAAAAVRAGATDFLVRRHRLPERVRTQLSKIRRLLRLVERSRALAAAERERWRIVGRSQQLQEVLRRVARVAAIPRPVLITGERGTGKELVARAIHDAAGPHDRPMVAVNCAAFPDSLLETELFGHERGAFTGSEGARAGKFEQADGGTLFLDEIGAMSLPFQQKILRVVEYGAFTRVGGDAEVRVSARIIAATNADLEERMRAGRFLRDLHDRLAFEVLHVPPLRERPEDVEELARHFLEGFQREVPSLQGRRLSEAALQALRRYPFPGNVRELKNVIERAACRGPGGEITPEDLGLPDDPGAPAGPFRERLEALERRLVQDALREAGGNQAQAARLLGLSYHQFRYYLRKHGAE
jgi:DNA-binding NtrC family response regulator